jgi:chromosomal replication initiator protein
MHRFGHAILDASPGASAIYMPGERFMFRVRDGRCARAKTLAFKARLRTVDLLMLDDLQFPRRQGFDAGRVFPTPSTSS